MKAGIPEGIVSQIISALEGEIDFNSDINPEDSFDIIYEVKTTTSGLEVGRKSLLFIGLKT